MSLQQTGHIRQSVSAGVGSTQVASIIVSYPYMKLLSNVYGRMISKSYLFEANQAQLLLVVEMKVYPPSLLTALHVGYFLTAIAYTLGRVFDVFVLILFKIFPLVILIVFLIPIRSNKPNLKLVFAIFFGALGDIVLGYLSSSLFPLGAGFFLIGHIIYNAALLDLWNKCPQGLIARRKAAALYLSVLLLSLAAINLVTTVSDKLKSEQPVLLLLISVYLVVLTSVSLNALLLLLHQRTPTASHVLIFIGALCFFASDNCLGRSRFSDFEAFGWKHGNTLVILVTYYLAQYFLILGFMKVDPQKWKQSLIETE